MADSQDTHENSLPAPAENQPVVQLSLLSGGYLHLPGNLFVEGASAEETLICPSMSWLITHAPTNSKIIFDLGLRRDIQNYPPGVYERLQSVVPVVVKEDVSDSLEKAGVDPAADVDVVIFSHLHYDHIGDPSHFGPKTKFVVGPGAGKLLHGPTTYPDDPHSHFDSRLLPRDRVVELPTPSSVADGADRYWGPLGPFSAARDYFGDGSVFIVDAPGHLVGHINLLVRVQPSKWMYLAGDTAHDVRLLNGTRRFAVYPDPHTGRPKCAHADKAAAEAHIRRVRKLQEMGDVEVVLAHDAAWFDENKHRFSITGPQS
ncbi:predicted protein [Uncinocarpus reesii 1704]|uniref:Metallo-beta-lactamase domain-containing protein n=1 Tax=Uncinocarpus reesii (strain UAMH 1704) TaxID=336963 RepID=C4JJN8_UNCRE|nr:uncharacterized protein UREG_01845 [Uncinocarpus reesii 1704]EEP76996.1 predicted protein [Uncinocarpus reesii 1704]